MQLRDELRAPRLEPDRVDRLVTMCDEIVGRVVSGQNPAELIYAFNREIGRVFGPTTFRGVFGSEECDDFVERILTEVPTEAPDVSDDEATEMVRRIIDGEVDDRESWYWVRLLAEHYDQPRFSDLVYWPSRDLRPDEVVEAARLSHEELDPYLDPSARGYHPDERIAASAGKRRVALRLLQEMSRLQMLEVVDGEAAVDLVAPILTTDEPNDRQAAAVAQALVSDSFVTSELYGSDAQIADLLHRVRTELV